MKEKGFTLIELLAVIVILAIIALIATPIILNIINDTKKSATDRSKEMYLDAIEQAIARKNLTTSFNPSTCTVKSDGNLNCDVGELVVEIKGQKPSEGGTITIKDGKIIENTLKFGDNVLEKQPTNTIGKAVTSSNKTLAGKIPQGNFELGDEYIVNVDGTNQYHFYVLNIEGDKVSLILSGNICNDGTLAAESNTCLIPWVSKEDYNDNTNYGEKGNNNKGPITAMNYLHEATKNWNNIPNIKMNYTDEGNNYGKIVTNENVTRLTNKDEVEISTYSNLKARLTKFDEIENSGCIFDNFGSCPAYMVNRLYHRIDTYPIGTKENIDGIYGYWGLSSYGYGKANDVGSQGNNGSDFVYSSTLSGIRPVIELSKSNLS